MKIVRKNLVRHLASAAYRRTYIGLFWKLPRVLPGIGFPRIAEVEITNDCNLGCVHCHRTRMAPDVGFMDSGVFRKLVDEMADYPVAFLRLVGQGEPALHPDFRDLMEYASGKGIKIEISTNGTVFERFTFDEILGWDIDILGVSIDGHDEKSYERIRKGGNYKRLAGNVRGFVSRRDELGQRAPLVCVKNVLFPQTGEHAVETFRKRWVEVADQVTFNALQAPPRPSQEATPTRCHLDIFFSAHINYDGSVRKCPYQFVYGTDESLGNLRDGTLREIWRSEDLKNLRRLHSERRLPQVCRDCHGSKASSAHGRKIKHFGACSNPAMQAINRVIDLT